MRKVYITNLIPDLASKMLKKKGFGVAVNESGRPLRREDLLKVLASYDAVLSSVVDKIDDEALGQSSANLKIIANYAVGFDNIDVLAAKRRGIVVTNTPGVAGEAVAEHTFALILACKKRLLEADRYVRVGKFRNFEALLFVSPQLWGKTIGIVGLGRIGTYVG
ncbi:D-glycerate dehydrogenase, partial [Candidatus Curtissbacteria bacterium]|nr:D-glycerate dehydrogenase [Candidatus Curtissbacteria bacterium]